MTVPTMSVKTGNQTRMKMTIPTIDRRQWPPGPWDGEPDKVQWEDDSGYLCMMVRNNFGAWCGYVGVPEDHPFYGKLGDHKVQVDKEELMKREVGESPPVILLMIQDAKEFEDGIVTLGLALDVHGGVTFTGYGGGNIDYIGQKVTDDVWWIGFDCSHCEDKSPGMDLGFLVDQQTYRDARYTEDQVVKLAKQLKEFHVTS